MERKTFSRRHRVSFPSAASTSLSDSLSSCDDIRPNIQTFNHSLLEDDEIEEKEEQFPLLFPLLSLFSLRKEI